MDRIEKPPIKREAVIAVVCLYIFFALSYGLTLYTSPGFKSNIYFKTAALDFLTKGLLSLPVWYFVFMLF